MEVTLWKWDTRFKFFETFFNLNKRQTSEILTVEAMIMRKKLQKQSSGGALQKAFCRKHVLRNLGKFTGKHLCQSLFFSKLQASGFLSLRTAFLKNSGHMLLSHLYWSLNFVKRDTPTKRFRHRGFPLNFANF